MKRSAFLLVGVGLLCLVLAAWWGRVGQDVSNPVGESAQAPTEDPPAPPSGDTGDPDFMDPFQELAQAPAPRPAGPPPKRIVQVPGESGAVEDPSPFDWQSLTAENLLERTVAAVRAALDGDLEASDSLIRTRMNCQRMPDSDEGIQQWAQRMTGASGRPERGPWRAFLLFEPKPTLEENEAELRRWRGACRQMDDLLGQDMAAELARLAEQGNVAARLLFAMSPPGFGQAPGEAVPFDAKFSWESLAREYSWLNLRAGAPEGFLAFGHSYLSGLFTPRDFTLAAAFMKAAMDCGQVSLASGGIVSRFENPQSESSWNSASTAEVQQMLTYYDGIMAYCH